MGRNVAGRFVNGNADVFDARGQVEANHLDCFFKRDVFVVIARSGFGGRCVNGFGQFAGVLQTCGQLDAAHLLTLLVFLPTTARQITAHHGFYGNRFQALDQHRAAFDLRHFCSADHAFGRIAREVNGAQVKTLWAELVEPIQGHLREQHAFARNGLAHDDVKGADAVGGHHQDAVGAHRIVVPDLAASQQSERR